MSAFKAAITVGVIIGLVSFIGIRLLESQASGDHGEEMFI